MFDQCLTEERKETDMAVTLKALIRKSKMRADKTWNVLIRLTYDRRVKYIATNEFVEKKDITASGRIKNMAVVERCGT